MSVPCDPSAGAEPVEDQNRVSFGASEVALLEGSGSLVMWPKQGDKWLHDKLKVFQRKDRGLHPCPIGREPEVDLELNPPSQDISGSTRICWRGSAQQVLGDFRNEGFPGVIGNKQSVFSVLRALFQSTEEPGMNLSLSLPILLTTRRGAVEKMHVIPGGPIGL